MTPGWQRFSDKAKQTAEDAGLRAVHLGILPGEEEALVRANERLKMVLEVEKSAGKLEELEEKTRAVQADGT